MKKTLFVILFLLLFLIVGAAAMLSLAALGTPSVEPLGRSPQLASLARYAPADAKQLYFVHSLASLYRGLGRSRIAGDAIASLSNERELRLATMVAGNADALFWLKDGNVHGVISATAPRRVLASLVAMFAALPIQSSGGLLFYGAEPATGDSTLPSTVSTLAGDLPGSFFLFDRREKGGGFPPLAPPSLTAVVLEEENLHLRARAVAAEAEAALPASPAFEAPPDAMLTAVFHGSSSALGDLDRIFPLNLDRLSGDGLMLVLYEIKADALIPHPRGVVEFPDTAAAREAVASLFNMSAIPGLDAPNSSRQVGRMKIDRVERLGVTLEVARLNQRIVLALDGKSLDRFLGSARQPLRTGAGEAWLLRVDPTQLAPVAEQLSKATTLKLLAPKVARRAADASRILALFPSAASFQASRSSGGGWDQIDLTVSPQK